MCPAARYACFTAGHTGPALRGNSTAALTGRRTPRAFVPLRKGLRIPTPVTRSLARNDSALRCSGGQGRPPLRSGYRWRSVRDVEDAVPYGRFSTAFRAGRRGRRPLRTVLDGVSGIRRGGLTMAGRKRIPPRRRDFSSCRWQADDGVSGIRRGGLTMAGRKRSRRQARLNIFSI